MVIDDFGSKRMERERAEETRYKYLFEDESGIARAV